LDCNPALPAPNTAGVTATDNCTASDDLSVTVLTMRDDTVGCIGTLIYKYTVRDHCEKDRKSGVKETYIVDNDRQMITECCARGDPMGKLALPGPNTGDVLDSGKLHTPRALSGS